MKLTENHKKIVLAVLLIAIIVALFACSSPTPQVVEITRMVPQTVVVTQVVTQIITVIVAPTSTPASTPTSGFTFWYPLPKTNCGLSIVHLGDMVYVNYGGTENAIRSDPDTWSVINIIGYATQGETMRVIGGPICNYNLLMWHVITEGGIEGWTPEGNGKDTWLVPTR